MLISDTIHFILKHYSHIKHACYSASLYSLCPGLQSLQQCTVLGPVDISQLVALFIIDEHLGFYFSLLQLASQ